MDHQKIRQHVESRYNHRALLAALATTWLSGVVLVLGFAARLFANRVFVLLVLGSFIALLLYGLWQVFIELREAAVQRAITKEEARLYEDGRLTLSDDGELIDLPKDRRRSADG